MKRFTETDKWKDPWFRRLDGRLKLLWLWLCDQCDHAGIIDPDMELAAFQIGVVVSEMDFAAFDGRLEKLENGKYMLTKFIDFQYGELSVDCRAHGPVFKSLENNRVSKGYPKGIHTLKDIYKDKDKDKDKDNTPKSQNEHPSMTEVVEYVKTLGLPANDGTFLFHHWEENGWKRGKEPIRNWKAAAQKWKSGGWLPSQKPQTNGATTTPHPTARRLA